MAFLLNTECWCAGLMPCVFNATHRDVLSKLKKALEGGNLPKDSVSAFNSVESTSKMSGL